MFERFTTGARQAIVLAQDESRRLHHKHIGTEHLLLGVLSEGGAGAGLLGTGGVTLEAARRRVPASDAPGTPGQIPFTDGARRALEQALREGLRLGHDYIGTEHLALGLLADRDGAAAIILDDLGVSRSAIAAEAAELQPSQGRGAVQSGFAMTSEPAAPERDLGYDECVAELGRLDGSEVIAVFWTSPTEIARPYRGRLAFTVESEDRALLRVSPEPPGISIDVWRAEFGGGRRLDAGALDLILATTRVAIFPD
jgi:ATP-dependent Clp protease ATP-binding subunit ClpA